MRNKILCLIALVMVALMILCSCEEPLEQNTEKTSSRFVLLNMQDADGTVYVYVDSQTKVQYMVFRGMECCDIQMLVDENGNPLIYEGELE